MLACPFDQGRRFLPVVLALALAACSGSEQTTRPDPTSGPVVAEYAGQRLTLRDFEEQYARTTGSREAAADDSLGAYQDFLQRYVDFRLKVQQARDAGLAEDSTYLAELGAYREQLARPYFLERQVIDEMVRDLYEKQKEEINASHLLIRVEETAPPEDTLRAYQRIAALRDSVVTGSQDFEELAAQYSEDPSAARNRGNLGYFSGGRMIHQFEDMAYGTPVGQVSPVFRTRFGYHILQVNSRRPASPEIRASHILIRIDGTTPADSAAALATVEQLQGRITAGEDFATLARQYSEDPGSGQQGGDLGFFGTGRMVPTFEEAAFGLIPAGPGAVSEPVLTQFGYHLIQLNDIKVRPSFDESYADLKTQAERLPRATERRLEIGAAYRKEVGSTLDTALVRQAIADIPQDSVLHRLVAQGFAGYEDRVFAQTGTTTYTLGAYGETIRNQRPITVPQPLQVLLRNMEQYLNEQAVDLAAARLEETDPNFRRIMQDYADGILLFGISEDSVWNVASTDSSGLKAYFEQRAGTYTFPERRRVVSFTSRIDSVLQRVSVDLQAGLTPSAIEARLAMDSLSVRIDTLFVSEAGGTVFDAALELQPGEASDILPNRSSQTILFVEAIEPPRAKTFEEARAEVITDYQSVLEARWVERLRAHYRARLYPERLRGAFQTPDGAVPPATSATR